MAIRHRAKRKGRERPFGQIDPNAPICPHCRRKARYTSRQAARDALARQRKRGVTGLNLYRCSNGGFHIGHAPPKKTAWRKQTA